MIETCHNYQLENKDNYFAFMLSWCSTIMAELRTTFKSMMATIYSNKVK